MPSLRSLILALLTLAFFSPRAAAQVEITEATTLVVAPAPRDSLYAEALARAVAHARISAVYYTGGQRAVDGGRIVAEQLGIERRPYDYDPLHEDKFAGWYLANLLPANPGRAVLVIAPREAIPFFLRRAAGVAEKDIGHIRTDDLFTITIAPSHASLVRAKLDLQQPTTASH